MRGRYVGLGPILLCVAVAACGSDGGSGGGTDTVLPGAQARRAVIAELGDAVILATYRAFEAATDDLVVAAEAYAGSGMESDLEQARLAWIETMDLWQRAEVFQVGPAGMMGAVAGGLDLRDAIYSWPLTNHCRIDQLTSDQTYVNLAGERVNVRGLDALEYLLFNESAANACPAQLPINAEGQWAALSTDEIARRRAAYAASAATILRNDAVTLRQAWDPAGGNFLSMLADPGNGDAAYEDAQAALNAISDAMFYVDTETKDMKLAIPAGLSMDCTETVCPAALESQFARRSREHVLENIRGFGLLYNGAGDSGLGLDDILREIGATDLDTSMTSRIASAEAAFEAIDAPLAEVLQSDPGTVIAAYEELKSMTDELKSQLITVLDLEAPARAVGDND